MVNLSQAVKQLQKERQRVQSELSKLDAAIHALNGSGAHRGVSSRPRRVLSAAARKRIAEAQRARWAKWKKMQKAA